MSSDEIMQAFENALKQGDEYGGMGADIYSFFGESKFFGGDTDAMSRIWEKTDVNTQHILLAKHFYDLALHGNPTVQAWFDRLPKEEQWKAWGEARQNHTKKEACVYGIGDHADKTIMRAYALYPEGVEVTYLVGYGHERQYDVSAFRQEGHVLREKMRDRHITIAEAEVPSPAPHASLMQQRQEGMEKGGIS